MSFDLKFLIITLVGLLISRAGIRAETPDTLVKKALAKNPELNFYVANIAAAKGTLTTAGTIRNPDLSTQAGYKNSRDNAGGANGDGATWSISFTQSFEYPGRISLRKAIANHDINLAELHLQQFRLTLAARVRALAYGVSSAQEKSAAAREIAERFQALSDVLAQRGAPGITSQLEARIIEATTLTFRRQEREAALAATTIAAELNQLCGQPANTALNITAQAVHFRHASLPPLLNAARAHAFDLRIRQAELAQQGSKVALSKNERYPAVAVGPYYSLENAADKEQQVGLGLSLPLPLWDRNAGNIATNKAREDQARASLIAAEREVERRVTQSAGRLETRRTEIENLEKDALPKFREAAQLADRNYHLGGVPLTIYLETQKQYLEVIGAVSEMRKDALEAALELEILTGQTLYTGEERP